MVKHLRRAIAMGCCCGLAAAPAQAVALTYVLDFAGAGVTTYSNALTPPTVFGGLQIAVSIPDASGLTAYTAIPSPSPAFLQASATGFTFTSPLGSGRGAIGFSGTICFANPTALLPTGPITLAGDNGCGAVTYTRLRGDRDDFTGAIVAFHIVNGDPYNLRGGFQALPSDVPEAATWAMMLVGFGGIGAIARRAANPTSVGNRRRARSR